MPRAGKRTTHTIKLQPEIYRRQQNFAKKNDSSLIFKVQWRGEGGGLSWMAVGSARTNAGELGHTLLKLESLRIDLVEAETHSCQKG